MTDRYAAIVDRCLADEDKARRDRVLAEYPENVQRIVRGMIAQLAKRLTEYVARGEDRTERNRRLAAIREPWLRERVRQMVIERFEAAK